MSCFKINIEYINGTILRKSLFEIKGILKMVVSLNIKMVNPSLSELDIKINFMGIYVGIERAIGKTRFVKILVWITLSVKVS